MVPEEISGRHPQFGGEHETPRVLVQGSIAQIGESARLKPERSPVRIRVVPLSTMERLPYPVLAFSVPSLLD
jgi:hypothetical protein